MKRVQLFFDLLINQMFNRGSYQIMGVHKNNKPMEIHIERFQSVRIGLLNNDFVSIGGYQDVVYTFDEKGKIMSRKRLKNIFSEKGNLIVGDGHVEKIYRENQIQQNWIKSTLALPGEINIG